VAISEYISHYRVVRKLGEGGMGEVYLASDTRLERWVALKILPAAVCSDPDRLARFSREARAAAAINHPKVAHIYEIGDAEGVTFIAMEYVEGEPLERKISSGGLVHSKVIDIAVQLADALDAAHSRGIVHRDIKPSNIIIDPRGQVKILDFGLARFAGQTPGGSSSELATLSQTRPGVLMGTPTHMSPEQALGRDVDQRTDIFSFGVVLYQMLTGRLPFAGPTVIETINLIINHRPEPMTRAEGTVSPEVERLVLKCLEKDPDLRYRTARDLLADLRNLGRNSPAEAQASPTMQPSTLSGHSFDRSVTEGRIEHPATDGAAHVRSVAVLPFRQLGQDRDDEYLGLGMADALITRLSNVRQIIVRPTSAVLKYADQRDPNAAGLELNVDSVLDGNIQRSGDRIRVTVQLVNVSEGASLWAHKFDEKFTDMFTVEDRVSEQVVDALTLKLTGEEAKRLRKPNTQVPAAYQAYLKGRYYLNKRTEQGFNRAIEFFNRAIDLDPDYALAYAMLAECYGALSSSEALGLAPKDAMPNAKRAALKALELDDALAEAHTSLGLVRLNYDWDWPAAESEFTRAIELNPHYAPTYHWFSHYFLTIGPLEKSLEVTLKALEIDPLDPEIILHLAYHYYCARDYDQAIDQCTQALDMDSHLHEVHSVLGGALDQKGMYEQAILEFQKAIDLSGGRPLWIAGLGHAYAASGSEVEARNLIRRLEDLSKQRYVSPVGIAMIYMGLGENDQALRWLRESREQHCGWLPCVKADPIFDALKPDPAFQDLLLSIGLSAT